MQVSKVIPYQNTLTTYLNLKNIMLKQAKRLSIDMKK